VVGVRPAPAVKPHSALWGVSPDLRLGLLFHGIDLRPKPGVEPLCGFHFLLSRLCRSALFLRRARPAPAFDTTAACASLSRHSQSL
jgi:hypothetical protein